MSNLLSHHVKPLRDSSDEHKPFFFLSFFFAKYTEEQHSYPWVTTGPLVVFKVMHVENEQMNMNHNLD